MSFQVIPLPAGTMYLRPGRDEEDEPYPPIPVFAAVFNEPGILRHVTDEYGRAHQISPDRGRLSLPPLDD